MKKYISYHNNGIKHEEFYQIDGKKEGTFEIYYENGQLSLRQNFKNDINDGVSESYYENGQLESRENYKLGKNIEISEYYHENGQLDYKVFPKDRN